VPRIVGFALGHGHREPHNHFRAPLVSALQQLILPRCFSLSRRASGQPLSGTSSRTFRTT